VLAELDRTHVDWSDFEEAGRQTRDLVGRLSEDKATLAALVERVGETPELLAMCERHLLLDYLVVYDAVERGFRIRLHASTEHHKDRPHDHRFSFSSVILRGCYQQTIHRVDGLDHYVAMTDDEARAYMDLDHAAPDDPQFNRFTQLLVRDELPGSCYSLHHSTIHTTFTTPDTISLFLRGPAEKSRSIIADRETNRLWWRFGADRETPERRNKVTISTEQYSSFCQSLGRLGVL
jgi:hypothetical protein